MILEYWCRTCNRCIPDSETTATDKGRVHANGHNLEHYVGQDGALKARALLLSMRAGITTRQAVRETMGLS